MRITRGCDVRHKNMLETKLTGVVESDNVLRSDGDAIFGSWPKPPLAQCGQHAIFDAVTDATNQLELDDIALLIDGDFDNHVALHARWQIGTRNSRVGKYLRQCWNDLVTGERCAGNAGAV